MLLTRAPCRGRGGSLQTLHVAVWPCLPLFDRQAHFNASLPVGCSASCVSQQPVHAHGRCHSERRCLDPILGLFTECWWQELQETPNSLDCCSKVEQSPCCFQCSISQGLWRGCCRSMCRLTGFRSTFSAVPALTTMGCFGSCIDFRLRFASSNDLIHMV